MQAWGSIREELEILVRGWHKYGEPKQPDANANPVTLADYAVERAGWNKLRRCIAELETVLKNAKDQVPASDPGPTGSAPTSTGDLERRVAGVLCGQWLKSRRRVSLALPESWLEEARAVIAEIAKAGCDGEPYARSVWAHDRKDPIALAVWNRDITWETWLAAKPGRAANVAAVDAAEKRVSELEAELEARKVSHSDSIDALQKDLAAVTRERDELKAAIASHDARRICKHVVAQLTEKVDSITKELTEWRGRAEELNGQCKANGDALLRRVEELRLQEPLVAFARNSRWTRAGSESGLDQRLTMLDAHRAKTSGSAGSAESAAPLGIPTDGTPAEPDLPSQSPSSADSDAQQTSGASGSAGPSKGNSDGAAPSGSVVDSPAQPDAPTLTYETAPTLEKGAPPRRVSPLLRCAVTKNLCGTDTWMEGRDCQCAPCQQWLRVVRVESAPAEFRVLPPVAAYGGMAQLGCAQPHVPAETTCTKSDQHDGPCNGFPRSTCHGFHAHQAEARRGSASLQSRVFAWAATTFGAEAVAPGERAARFVEEATELAQAEGVPLEKLLGIAKHVYSKEPGDPSQEAGGVGITLLAYCEAKGFSAAAALETEFARVQAIPVDYFRKRHNAKADAGIAVRVPEGGAA